MRSISLVAPAVQPQISMFEYDRLVRAIHAGGLDNQALSTALEALRVQFDANYVTLILRIPGIEEIGLMIVAGNFEAHGQVAYFTYHHVTSPFGKQAVDTVFTQQDVMSDEQWGASSYYQDYCRGNDVHHIMGVDISTFDEGVLRLRITRSSAGKSFSADDRALCSMLIPHLRQSLHVHNLLGRSESMGEVYAQAINRLSLAAIVLDEAGTVLQLNDVARSLLDQADGLKMVGGRLEATYPSDNRELHKLLHSAFDQAHQQGGRDSREVLSISRPSGEVNLGVVVEAIPAQGWGEGRGQPRVVVYVRDAVGKSQANNNVAKQLFNFTPAETALALELANGLSLEEAAEALGIMRNTARAHLRAIFSKTGVRRQAELVRVMLNSVVSLGANSMMPLKRPTETAQRPELKRVR